MRTTESPAGASVPEHQASAPVVAPRLFGRAFHYGWIVVGLTFASTLVAAGVRSAPTVFIVPLGQEFGWNRAEIAAAVSINLLLYGLAAPISGRLADIFGPRRVMLASLSLLGLGVIGTVKMSALWQLDLLWGLVVGLGAGGSASVIYVSVASRWFVAQRGIVLGILSGANSTGQILFVPVLMAIIVAAGWRAASLVMVLVIAVVLPPLALWMRDDPADVGLEPYGAASGQLGSARVGSDGAAVPLAQVLRTPEFWLLAGSFFTCGATSTGLVGTNFIPHSIDHGIPEVTAASALAVMGVFNVLGVLASGWITDRMDARRFLSMVYGLRGLSLFVLPFVTQFSGLMIFSVVYGLDWFATVPPTVALATRRFGRQSVGMVFGCIFVLHQLGAALAAAGGGMVRVWLGDYEFAFLAGGVLALLGGGMALLIPRPLPAQTAQAVPAV